LITQVSKRRWYSAAACGENENAINNVFNCKQFV
jgi:hypothetical protein